MKKILIGFALCILMIAFFISWGNTLGFILGLFWGLINLYFIKQLFLCLVVTDQIKPFKGMLMILLKFPFLYALGYVLLLIPIFSPWSLLVGFSVSFAKLTQLTQNGLFELGG